MEYKKYIVGEDPAWFFLDEDDKRHGPFATREAAEKAFDDYLRKRYALGEGLLNQD